MNREKPKKSRSAPSDGFLGWLYDLLFPRKNAGVDDAARESSTRETIPEHDSGRAEKLFAQMQQENESATPAPQAASTTDTRTAHQDASESGSHHHATSASHDDGGSSSSCDSDSGSSSGGD
jgi:hypothetical protein